MNLKHQLTKSLTVAPAEAALRRADNPRELDDAWDEYCDGFADESPEHTHLLAIYDEQIRRFVRAIDATKILRV